MKILQDRQEHSIKFLFIGGGAKTSHVQKFVEQENLENIFFFDFQPSALLRESLSAADIHWMSLIPELESFIVPSKFYGASAVARPIIHIGDPHGEIASLIRANDCGYAIAPHRCMDLADKILELSGDPEKRAKLGANARKMVETHFAREFRLQEWKNLVAPEGQIAIA